MSFLILGPRQAGESIFVAGALPPSAMGCNLAESVTFRALIPLVFPKTGPDLIADRLVSGSLPTVLDSSLFREELRNYVGLYLDEEIRAESYQQLGDMPHLEKNYSYV